MRRYCEAEIISAAERCGLTQEAADTMVVALRQMPEETPSFQLAHVSYYFGALLIIGAMGWFITSAWDTLSGIALSAIGLVYAIGFGVAGVLLYRRPFTRIPGGLLATVAVCMTPLVVYGLERQLGWWPATDPGAYTRFHPYINGSWVWIEAATLLVASLFLRFVPFPFLTAPAAYALWYMSMDATELLFGRTWTHNQDCWIAVAFGFLMLVVAYVAEAETAQDFAFWFYFFGLLAFTGGLTAMGGGTQLTKAIYCGVHLVLILLSILLQRRTFIVFGALGVFFYLANEAETYFRNSFLFTLMLTLLGVALLAAGFSYKKYEVQLAQALSPLIPARVRRRQAQALA